MTFIIMTFFFSFFRQKDDLYRLFHMNNMWEKCFSTLSWTLRILLISRWIQSNIKKKRTYGYANRFSSRFYSNEISLYISQICIHIYLDREKSQCLHDIPKIRNPRRWSRILSRFESALINKIYIFIFSFCTRGVPLLFFLDMCIEFAHVKHIAYEQIPKCFLDG